MQTLGLKFYPIKMQILGFDFYPIENADFRAGYLSDKNCRL